MPKQLHPRWLEHAKATAAAAGAAAAADKGFSVSSMQKQLHV